MCEFVYACGHFFVAMCHLLTLLHKEMYSYVGEYALIYTHTKEWPDMQDRMTLHERKVGLLIHENSS